MHFNLKYISALLLGVTLGISYMNCQPKILQLQPATEVYKEVAHISPTEFSNATLIYTDSESDISYYVANDRIQRIYEGAVVRFENGSTGYVREAVLRGMYVGITDSDVHAGMSGTPVWFGDEIVGYVSSLQDSTTLYCIWAN